MREGFVVASWGLNLSMVAKSPESQTTVVPVAFSWSREFGMMLCFNRECFKASINALYRFENLEILRNCRTSMRSMRNFYPSNAGLRMTNAAKATSVLVALIERSDVPAH